MNFSIKNCSLSESDFKIICKQIEKYKLKSDVQSLAQLSKAGNHKILDLAGRIALNSDEEVIYNFGKHKGRPVQEVLANEPGYYAWMMKNDFSRDTKMRLKEIKLSPGLFNIST